MKASRKTGVPADRWVFGRQLRLGELKFRQCKGACTKRVYRHDSTFLGVADIAGLLWCEIQATISQCETQEGYIEAAWADDHQKGEATSSGRRNTPSQHGTLPEDRFAAGRRAQELHAHYHYSIRRHWDFGDYLVIGVPDSVEKEFVYEFKYSKYPRSAYTFKNAMAQANVYGSLFGKKHFKIHLAGPDGYEKIIDGDVREDDARALIDKAWKLMNGSEEFERPATWKCSPCKYRSVCTVPTENRVPTASEIRAIAANAKQLTIGAADPPSAGR